MAAKATFFKGQGCAHCSKSGYRGRQAIFELMMMSSRIRELTFAEAPTAELRKAAISEGMKTLYRDGIEKVLRGVTTIDEVFRVAKQTEQD
jgi:type IV pilus assembly protein PilB